MGSLWTLFCGETNCSNGHENGCGADLIFLTHPSSCINHALIICFDVLLLIMFFFTIFSKTSFKSSHMAASSCKISSLQLVSAVYNGFLGFVYFALGVWILEEKLRRTQAYLPLHWWMLFILHGLIWLLLGLTVSLRGQQFSRAPLRLLSILAFLFAGLSCSLSLFTAILVKQMTIKIVLDVLWFVGSSLLILCTYKGFRYGADDENDIYDPLLSTADDSNKTASVGIVTPFAKASCLSKFTFWWLNPLMKRGKEKTLEDEDIPKLREDDQAESCYLQYAEINNRRKQSDPSAQPSILTTILLCHWKEIFISGFFALLKVITISAGPLLLKAFIKVAEGKESSPYEKYILVLTLFLTKILESVSQRQWYFRCRLIGLKVRSLITAAIYQKQLRLSNAAKLIHSSGEIMNYVTVDAYRIGEFPFWFHQIWTTSVQLCFAIIILFQAVGLSTIAAMIVIVLTVVCNMPLAKLQHKFQSKLMVAQDERLKAMTEALVNMKVLKLYAWETHFRHVIESLRKIEDKWLKAVQLRKSYNSFLFWSSPVLVSAATFGACYFLGVPLSSSNVFTFVATLRLVQDPVRSIPDVIGVFIQAKVAFARIVKFLEAPELETANVRVKKSEIDDANLSVAFNSANLSWDENPLKPTLRNISLTVRKGDKIAICGEVGSGKSTLLAAILGEIPITEGTVQVHGTIAYVSQSAWIQTGTIRDNILFGSALDNERYQDTLERCSLVKDLELLPYGDLTEIGERGVNLSGGQKQRIQLARALYKDADIYLLDDPFSAVDAHTATSLFNDYVMGALSEKTVLLVTHQVDFLPAFDSVLLMSDGEILHAAPYTQLLDKSQEFQNLVHAHKETAGAERLSEVTASQKCEAPSKEIHNAYAEKKAKATGVDQLIKKEEREVGDTGFKPYILYLKQNNTGFLVFAVAALCHLTFVIGQIIQNSWMAANVDDPHMNTLRLIIVYLLIGVVSSVFLLTRTLSTVVMGMNSSRALFSQLLISLFRAPMSFYDSTPLGRILSRVSSDLSIVDLDVPFNLIFTVGSTTNCYANLAVLAVITWQVLFVSVPMIFLAIRLQKYYYSSAKELMRINGTTKSFVANHLAESVAGVVTIRAFKEEDRFFAKNLELIDTNGSPFFHYFSANEWLIQRLETLSATVLAFAGLCMVLLPPGTFSSGFIGMALSYGLSLNMSLVFSINNQCMLANYIISVERLDQYMHIPSEAPEVINNNRPPVSWPTEGKVEIQDLQIKYRPDAPLVLRGISCTFEGGQKIGIVGRTGSGKTTLIGALFRLVEPAGGKIVVDGIDISKIGLHDLRSRFGIIPQDPTLFTGSVRYNLDPLGQHTDEEIWKVLGKCQLKEAVQEKEGGLDSPVVEDGSNWSMGQRQLFCLGRALLRRSKILVLDEATASIDNTTDMILQKTIRTEFADCTVITVAHRIPTVMDSTMVLAISDGKLVEFDEPMKLMKREDSLFGQLVQEYCATNCSKQMLHRMVEKCFLPSCGFQNFHDSKCMSSQNIDRSLISA
ncbi:ABC transporter C family member 10 [Sesamum angolense]|uniref:ABC-type xenobiotic transporter n=1 Tax=Sesamum angolense TaxID=2727404 RepID=A0AAE1W1G1_9LAMI|nr:ABC transporter C family member 10 [Sesamum angolense]